MSSLFTDTHDLLSTDEALHHGASKGKPTGIWQFVLSVFMLAYLVPVVYWLFHDMPTQLLEPPPTSELKAQLESATRKTMIAFGSSQHWSVFSPTLNHTIYHETALITFKDGATKIYEFPRMAKLSYFERFKHEKLRKIFGDCIPWPGYEQFLPSVASYLALSNNDDANPPTILVFQRNTNENPKPDPKNWNYRDKLPWHTTKDITFVYGVRRNDIEVGNLDPKRSNSRIYENTGNPTLQGGMI